MAGNLQIHSSDLSGYQQYKIHLLTMILLFNKHRAKSLWMQPILAFTSSTYQELILNLGYVLATVTS